MCGIVSYLGYQDPVPILIEGLRRLEYRGYDSALFNWNRFTFFVLCDYSRGIET